MGKKVPAGEQLVLAIYVRNLERSARFFTDFGFVINRRDGVFMELRWDDSLLFLVEMPDVKPPEGAIGNVRVVVEDVDGIYEKARALGHEIVTDIGDRYYGMRDFVVAGPDGINLRFAALRP
ncbi:Glyoxalase-like domain-containing protein [Desulfacinum hydrothermale DSM 13146]|uniref:Glyoxalase-like domain-containing protein n=1 Tax=Desulfacinum hydrothermale DSM 13146 TaxID=1121390 RepID=A0A1W1XG28_9BACT|nr:VOC family protein [Desulfacinum hydrothermale]SMC22923.1 Glyoxalase-like domain-containing protein [Desulfacinum hydrothermale DSM 13146]